MTTYLVLMRLGLGYPLAILGVIVVALILALLFRYGLHRPMVQRGAPTTNMVVATIAFGLVLTAAAELGIGNTKYGVDPIIPGPPIIIGGISIQTQSLLIVVVSWVLVAAIWFFFTKTLTGVSLRAVGLNRNAAAVSGVRVSRLITLAFILSVIVTAVGGMLVAPLIGAGPDMGTTIAVKGFAAAVLGGMASVYRGMVAGVVIGLIEMLSSYYVSSSWAPVIAYAILFFALVLMPARVRQSGAHA
ncbi:branched-chain amino acid ABC transporter permease [Microbacterium elymi]|uniref:Branched-chain amino acid ABC transporter permease n=1 Tax=Microbacterium elymi TaxID=2909587 RepID=A0ABY5NHL2_9MICO|nr:branched-chain amino acid ABC transporter permease [Microbacterium elymi]UUT34662.1 branched-chain amino acid ABC transporter permease [Microbacterium elymi]